MDRAMDRAICYVSISLWLVLRYKLPSTETVNERLKHRLGYTLACAQNNINVTDHALRTTAGPALLV